MRLNAKSTIISAGLASLLALSACSSSEGESAPSPTEDDRSGVSEETTEETPVETDEETTEPVETEEAEEAPAGNYDVSAVDFGEFSAITAPGTELSKGQPAWLSRIADYDGEEVEFTVGVSVLEVRELSASMFDEYSNADEFLGDTPYAIVVQHTWLEDAPADNELQTVDLFPLREDGDYAAYLTSGFSPFSAPGDECGLDLPEYNAETRTLVSCFVGISEDEVPVVTAEYDGEDYGTVVVSADNEYFEAPLSWS